MTDIILSPAEELDEMKKDLANRIAIRKKQIKQINSDLRTYNKLSESAPDRKKLIDDAESKIIEVTKELSDLEVDLKGLNRTREDENDEKIQAALLQVSNWLKDNPSCAYVIDDKRVVFIEDYSVTPSKQNVHLREYSIESFIDMICSELNICSWHLPVPLVKDLFSKAGKSFQLMRYTVDNDRWNSKKIYRPLDHMKKYFIDKFEIPEESAKDTGDLQYFDYLMYSLSGGKKENQDHIEKWILHKVINYNKITTTPDIVIVGHVGGNGKGIIQAIIRMMFPTLLTGRANSKTLTGNFNSIMLGKFIVFFDDQDSREISLDVVKQLAGSDSMIFEPKGKDQFEGEKTHTSAWFSNRLPFKLTPDNQEGGINRRFSIMRTQITFLESLRMHVRGVNNEEMSVSDSKAFAEVIVPKFLFNRVSIAKWFKHLQKKHPEVNEDFTLDELHGEDYRYFLKRQQDSYDLIMEELIKPEIESNGCVPIFVIKEILRHLDGKEVGDKTIFRRITDLVTTNRMEIEVDRHRITIVSGGTNALGFRSSNIPKQCSVIRPKNMNDWKRKEFDWNLVSSGTYIGKPSKGEPIITEDSFIFGSPDDKTDSESDTESKGTEMENISDES